MRGQSDYGTGARDWADACLLLGGPVKAGPTHSSDGRMVETNGRTFGKEVRGAHGCTHAPIHDGPPISAGGVEHHSRSKRKHLPGRSQLYQNGRNWDRQGSPVQRMSVPFLGPHPRSCSTNPQPGPHGFDFPVSVVSPFPGSEHDVELESLPRVSYTRIVLQILVRTMPASIASPTPATFNLHIHHENSF